MRPESKFFRVRVELPGLPKAARRHQFSNLAALDMPDAVRQAVRKVFTNAAHGFRPTEMVIRVRRLQTSEEMEGSRQYGASPRETLERMGMGESRSSQ